MGTLCSETDWTGRDIDGCTLGDPAGTDPLTGWHIWDHPTLPTGMIDTDGTIWIEEKVLP